MTFTHRVAKHVIQEGLAKGENVICSPVSIDVLLSILTAGSNNSTLEQLLTLLGRTSVEEVNAASQKLANILKVTVFSEGAPVISNANALWLDRRFSLKPMFQKVLRDVHNAEARVVDFRNQPDQVVKDANTWAEQETKGLIKQILSRDNIKDDTIMLLMNALHFKGTWYKSFGTSSTRDAYFTLLNQHKVQVPFMNQYNQDFDYGTFQECRVLRMPYRSGVSFGYRLKTKTLSMYIFLPNEYNGLPNLLEKIEIDENLFRDQVKLDYVKINQLSIPKFSFESHVPLKKSMKQLGLTLPFEITCRDFSGIVESEDKLYVSDIVQQCRVETNEQGTEAAAISHTAVAYGCLPPSGPHPSEINFVSDHPFLFMIREDVSGALLFVGTMLEPRTSQ